MGWASLIGQRLPLVNSHRPPIGAGCETSRLAHPAAHTWTARDRSACQIRKPRHGEPRRDNCRQPSRLASPPTASRSGTVQPWQFVGEVILLPVR